MKAAADVLGGALLLRMKNALREYIVYYQCRIFTCFHSQVPQLLVNNSTQLKHDQARPKFEPSTKALWLLSCPLTWRRTAASTSQLLSLLSSYIAGVLQPELVGDALVHETGASIVPFLM